MQRRPETVCLALDPGLTKGGSTWGSTQTHTHSDGGPPEHEHQLAHKLEPQPQTHWPTQI